VDGAVDVEVEGRGCSDVGVGGVVIEGLLVWCEGRVVR